MMLPGVAGITGELIDGCSALVSIGDGEFDNGAWGVCAPSEFWRVDGAELLLRSRRRVPRSCEELERLTFVAGDKAGDDMTKPLASCIVLERDSNAPSEGEAPGLLLSRRFHTCWGTARGL